MNKFLSIALVMAFCVSLAEAQTISKPVKGDRLFELNASGLDVLSISNASGGIMIRDFMADNKVRRIAANLNLIFEADSGGSKRLNDISLSYGMENHMKGSKRMSTYWGYSGGIRLQSTDNIGLTGGFFTGFDYYIADGLYLGTEAGYGANLTIRENKESAIALSLPGASMNARIRMGYRF